MLVCCFLLLECLYFVEQLGLGCGCCGVEMGELCVLLLEGCEGVLEIGVFLFCELELFF